MLKSAQLHTDLDSQFHSIFTGELPITVFSCTMYVFLVLKHVAVDFTKTWDKPCLSSLPSFCVEYLITKYMCYVKDLTVSN